MSGTGIDEQLAQARSRLKRVSARDAWREVRSGGAWLVDIRPAAQRAEEGEVSQGLTPLVIERNVLEWRFDPRQDTVLPGVDFDTRVIVMCQEGYTSSLAADALRSLGLSRATDLVGGFAAWRGQGLPVGARASTYRPGRASVLCRSPRTCGRACGRMGDMATQICIAQDEAADKVLGNDPFALLTGMLLDQQFPMERAFAGPAKVLERFGTLEPAAVAAAEPDSFADLCATPPAVHRYGRSMAGRIQALATVVRDEYAGDASRIWSDATSGSELFTRIKNLPGFGEQKAKIFVALLAKQLAVRPDGWEKAAGAYSEEGSFRSVADVVDAESLQKVRDFKKATKAAAKAAQG